MLCNLVTSLLSLTGQVHVVLCVPCEISRRGLQRKPHGLKEKKKNHKQNNQGILIIPVKTGFNLSETWRYQVGLVAKFKSQAISF